GIRDFHVTGVQTCALPIFFVGNDRELQITVLGIVHVVDPFQVLVYRVGRQAKGLNVTGRELLGQLGGTAHLSGTYRGKVSGVAEIGRASGREGGSMGGGDG